MPAWTDAETEQMWRLKAEGMSIDGIARLLGKTVGSVHGRLNRCKQPPPLRSESEAMRDSALASEVARLKDEMAKLKAPKRHEDRLPVTTNAAPPIDPETLWKHAEEDSARRIAYAHERSRFRVEFPENKPIAVCAISDQHIAPGTPVDFGRMRADAERIRDTDGLYAILGGDGVDNHIKHRAAVLAARSQPAEQWQLYEWYLSIFAPKIMCLISGNHDAWTDQFAGIDEVSRIAERQRLCYAPAEARMETVVGGQSYRLAIRHQYRMNSSMNQTHAVKQWHRFGEETFDIGIVCHHHEAAVEVTDMYGEEKWFARPGSYQITSAYSRQFGYNSTYPTCPTFILFPGEREIVGFRNIRQALRTLEAERA